MPNWLSEASTSRATACLKPNSNSSMPIELDPKDPAPREALVRLYMAEGKKADAEAFLKQAKIDLSDVPKATLAGRFLYSPMATG